MDTNNTVEVESKPIVIERTFDAPVERVWSAWSTSEDAKQWWGPKAFTCPVAEIDFRVGGKSLLAMRGPDGNDIYSTGTYLVIEPMKKIVSTDSFADADGNIVSAAEYGMNEPFPEVLEVTVTFKEEAGKTHMTLQHIGIPTSMYNDCIGGWNESFDKLKTLVEKKSTEANNG